MEQKHESLWKETEGNYYYWNFNMKEKRTLIIDQVFYLLINPLLLVLLLAAPLAL